MMFMVMRMLVMSAHASLLHAGKKEVSENHPAPSHLLALITVLVNTVNLLL